jgi:hypothetical protein
MADTKKITAAKITAGTELLTLVTPYTEPGWVRCASGKATKPGRSVPEWRTVAAVEGRVLIFTDGLRGSSSTGAVVWQTR